MQNENDSNTGKIFLLVGIISIILATSYLFIYKYYLYQADVNARNNCIELKIAIANYKMDIGSFPTKVIGIDGLIIDPGVKGWKGPYYSLSLIDPWGTKYIYDLVKGKPIVSSAGKDCIHGNDDDVYERF
ncbi:MAG: hypothetical protein COA79_21765 [Planctomycetota bacterium]|nr:MAG: hypothetical protein COA79_21765 [Planctomycetota bacterium]